MAVDRCPSSPAMSCVTSCPPTPPAYIASRSINKLQLYRTGRFLGCSHTLPPTAPDGYDYLVCAEGETEARGLNTLAAELQPRAKISEGAAWARWETGGQVTFTSQCGLQCFYSSALCLFSDLKAKRSRIEYQSACDLELGCFSLWASVSPKVNPKSWIR